MNRKVIGTILTSTLLYLLSGCGGTGTGNLTKSFIREDASLGHIQAIAVFPFEGTQATRIREFTITQVLASGTFDVVDKGRVDNLLQQEVIAAGAPLNSELIQRLGKRLNVQAIIFGSAEETLESRGNATFPEITITLRLIDTETGLILWQASGRGSGYSLTDRLFGTTPKDSFQVTMNLLNDLFLTMQ